ncbi:hypothetical protein Hanom_Chr16g01436271 [Helianthus anomalus]
MKKDNDDTVNEDIDIGEECGTFKKWEHLYVGCALKPSKIIERIRDNPDEDGILFKYDFLVLFINTMCLDENVVVEDVNWCKYICEMVKVSKDGWQRDNTSRYFNGALIILVIYVDRTLCGDIKMNRTTSPLEFWTKDMLSRREKLEMKNDIFGKGVLREW